MVKLYRVVLPNAVCGVDVHAGIIVDAAPFLRRWRGRAFNELEGWVAKCGGTVEYVADAFTL